MNLTCRKEILHTLIQSVSRVSSRHPSLPVLSTVLLEVTDNTLTASATNLDIGITASVDVLATKNGVCAVPPSPLLGYLSNLPADEKVEVSLTDNTLSLHSKLSSAKIIVVPHEDFPSIPQADGGEVFTTPSGRLINGFKSVMFAAASSNIKPELSSVLVAPDDTQLVFVATDGFRLAEKRIEVGNIPHTEPFLIPAKNAAEIIRMLPEEEEVSVAIGKSIISFSSGNTYIASRLVEGTYPDYKQLLTGEAQVSVIVDSEEFSRALKATAVFADTFNKLTLTTKKDTNTLIIQSRNTEVGENSVTVSAKVTGDHTQNFNQRYLNDPLTILTAKNLSFSFTGNGRPLIVRGEGDTTYTYLVMPMNR